MQNSKVDLSEQVAELIDLMNKAHFVTSLTGAGISVDSDIPDMEMMDNVFGLFEESTLENQPKKFYRAFHKDFIDPIFKTGPNLTHKVMASLEKEGILKGIVTTNVDYLHELAGALNVADIWSTLNVNHCLDCGRIYDINILKNDVPRCPVCNGLISPDPVFRHIATLPDQRKMADDWMAESDLTIVTGSNGYYSRTSNQAVVNINPKLNSFDRGAKLVIRATSNEVFQELARQMNLKV